MISGITFVGLLIYIVQTLVLSFILWMAVDAAVRNKYLWIVLILGLPLVGSLIYLFIEKKEAYYKIICKHCRDGVCTNHAK